MPHRCTDLRHSIGLRRRELLQVGFSALAGINLGRILVRPASAGDAVAASAARAKSVLLIFLTGGASHHDTFDPKPNAPAEIRGPFAAVDTSVPGLQYGEHLPQLAQRAERLALIRSMSHREFSHLPATHRVLTGAIAPNRNAGDLEAVASRRDFPCYAAALEFLRPRRDGIPSGVALPTHLVEGPLTWPGQNAGCLGAQFDPWQINQDPNAAGFREESLSLPIGYTLDRVSARRSLLTEINACRDRIDKLADRGQFGDKQELALEMLTSGKVARAFELDRERPETRDRYGRHTFGQSLLLSRRLLEAGVPIVQANMGIVQTWDTHVDNFPRLKNQLLPPLDRAISAVLDDLHESGRLEETLVIITGEFGRTPKISTLPGTSEPGRDHWASVFTSLFAGAGVVPGRVIGQSDEVGAYPAARDYSLFDLGATVYDSLGVDPAAMLRDQLGRPLPLHHGEPIAALFTRGDA